MEWRLLRRLPQAEELALALRHGAVRPVEIDRVGAPEDLRQRLAHIRRVAVALRYNVLLLATIFGWI